MKALPIITIWTLSAAMVARVPIQSGPKLMQPFPHQKAASDKIWFRSIFWLRRCIHVWKCEQKYGCTHGSTIVYYKLTLWSISSGGPQSRYRAVPNPIINQSKGYDMKHVFLSLCHSFSISNSLIYDSI